MGKEIITFNNAQIGKQKFHGCKNPISIYGGNIDRIVVSNKFSFGEKGLKYIIECEDDYEKIILLCIMLPKSSAYRRDFDATMYICF